MKAKALVLISATIIVLANALFGLLIVGNRIHELRRIHRIVQLSPGDRERGVAKLTPSRDRSFKSL
jgi:hypothetical protein